MLLVNKGRLDYRNFLILVTIRIRKYSVVYDHCCLFFSSLPSLLSPLLLAGRQMLMCSHPLLERRLAVANGATTVLSTSYFQRDGGPRTPAIDLA